MVEIMLRLHFVLFQKHKGNMVNTAIKKTKNIRYRLLCINPVLLYVALVYCYLRVVPFPEGIRRIR